jgi:hypothetical protein
LCDLFIEVDVWKEYAEWHPYRFGGQKPGALRVAIALKVVSYMKEQLLTCSSFDELVRGGCNTIKYFKYQMKKHCVHRNETFRYNLQKLVDIVIRDQAKALTDTHMAALLHHQANHADQ